jgi:ATP-dependent exoDNAse (exonuclease V) beta subunit
VHGYSEAVARLRETARAPFRRPSADRADPNESRQDGSVEQETPAATPPGDLLRTTGQVVHLLLEHWDGDDGTSLRRRAGPVCQAVLADRQDLSLPELVSDVHQVIEAFLASPLAERFRRITVLGREVPLLFQDDGDAGAPESLWRGFIDLLYRDPEGGVVVADYKTDRDLDGEAAAARYRPQLLTYARAVRAALDLPDLPHAELWMLRTGECRKVMLPGGDTGSG